VDVEIATRKMRVDGCLEKGSHLSLVRLYRDRFSVTCSTEMFLTQRNISYGFSNREPECIVYRIILRLRSTLNFDKFPKFETYQQCFHYKF
jgi:hypothetical protein